MTFNTMCDFCKGSHFFQYEKRLKVIKKIINEHQADLIALQELRSHNQVKFLFKEDGLYQTNYYHNFFLSYPDPLIAFNKKKFTLIQEGHFWLGPAQGRFSFGWEIALPRLVKWVKLQKNQTQFYFISTHFDNLLENLKGSAKMLNQFAQKLDAPIIFAADTNLTREMQSYPLLTKKVFLNIFDLPLKPFIKNPTANPRDLCYLRKGKVFPECQVDHILLSKRDQWSVKHLEIDLLKTSDKKFPSDHRPIITTIKLLSKN